MYLECISNVCIRDKDVESVTRRLEDDIPREFDWFQQSRMIANPESFQVMFHGLQQHQEFLLEIGSKIINTNRSVKLLGIAVDDELKIDKHVESLYQNVCRKSVHSQRLHFILTRRRNPVSYIHNVKFQLP